MVPIGSDESTITASYDPSAAFFKKATPALTTHPTMNSRKDNYREMKAAVCTIANDEVNARILESNCYIREKLLRDLKDSKKEERN